MIFLLLSTSIIVVSGQEQEEQEEQEYDFYAILPEYVEVYQGCYTFMEVVVEPIGEYTWNVSLIADPLTLPEGIEIEFQPDSVIPPATVVMNISALPDAETGVFTVTIIAQGLGPGFPRQVYDVTVGVELLEVEEAKYDLAPVYLHPIQVTKRLGSYSYLVHKKNTLFEVGISSTFPNTVSAKIKLVFQGYDRQEYITDPLFFRPRTTTYYILPLEDDLETESGWKNLELVKAPKPTSKPAGVYVEVDPDNAVEEKFENNNRMPAAGFQTTPVRNTPSLWLWYRSSTLFAGDNFTSLIGTGDSHPIDTFAMLATEFILGTYPVADHEILYFVSEVTRKLDLSWLQRLGKDASDFWKMSRRDFNALNRTLRLPSSLVYDWDENTVAVDITEAERGGYLNATLAASIDFLYWMLRDFSRISLRYSSALRQCRAVFVTPQNWFRMHFHQNLSNNHGGQFDGLRGAVIAEVGYVNVPAHEIGHTYGLWGRGDEEYYHTPPGEDAYGFWVNKYVEIDPNCIHDLQLDHDFYPGYCFMGYSTNVMNKPFRDGLHSWICDADYKKLQRNYPNTDPEVLLVDGIIYKDGSVHLFPFNRIPNSAASVPLGTSGNYYITLLDSDGQSLGEVGFNATFTFHGDQEHVETEFTPFMFTIPWINGTAQIQIIDETGRVLASRTVSPNPPQVTIVSPKGGETFYIDGECHIELEATDPDGDPVALDILYSMDEGETWYPLIMDLTGNQLEWDLTPVPPGEEYLIRIIASDGVNSVEVTSDAAFTVVEGAPPPPLPMTTIIIVVVAVAAIALIALYFKKKRKE